MTLLGAINQIDILKPNTYSQSDKVRWLSMLDGMIKKEIIDTHEGGEGVVFIPYDENTPLDTVLLVPAPHEDVYIKWLEAQIDYANGEFARYNNSLKTYNAAYMLFARSYNREHMPRGTRVKFF